MKYEPIPLTEEEIKKNQAIVEKVLDEVIATNKAQDPIPPIKNLLLPSEKPIDYRTLLTKYLAHVGEMEGIDFINRCKVGYHPGELWFTKDEVSHLLSLSAESLSLYR